MRIRITEKTEKTAPEEYECTRWELDNNILKLFYDDGLDPMEIKTTYFIKIDVFNDENCEWDNVYNNGCKNCW